MRPAATVAVVLVMLVRAASAEERTCVVPGVAGALGGWLGVGVPAALLMHENGVPVTGTSMGLLLAGSATGAALGPILTCRGPFSEGRLVPAATFVTTGFFAGYAAAGLLGVRAIQPGSEGGALLAVLVATLGGGLGGWLGYRIHRWRLDEPVVPSVEVSAGEAVLSFAGRF